MNTLSVSASVIQNPVLKGFNPDPSILRVGKDYYIATSTFEWFREYKSTTRATWSIGSCSPVRSTGPASST